MEMPTAFGLEREGDEETTNGAISELLVEFNEELRVRGEAEFDHYLDRCPEQHRQELLSLMNVLHLAFHALAPFRANAR